MPAGENAAYAVISQQVIEVPTNPACPCGGGPEILISIFVQIVQNSKHYFVEYRCSLLIDICYSKDYNERSDGVPHPLSRRERGC